MRKPKIARLAYRRAAHADLLLYAERVYKRTYGVPVYVALQAEVTPLADLCRNYSQGLVAAMAGERGAVLAKNKAREVLMYQLDRVVLLLVDAGFHLQKSKPVILSAPIPPPHILQAISTGQRGEVRLVLDVRAPRRSVGTLEIQYSMDRQGGWQHLQYHSRLRFVARGLPPAPELWLRVRSFGTPDRASGWSEVVGVGVL